MEEKKDIKDDTATTSSGWTLLHGLFEQAARKYSERVAVSHNGDSITYADLDDKADRVSCSLIERGVRVEDVVAISMPKSIETIIAILGTLKAGAAYLPIDITYPDARKQYMLSNSKAKYILAAEGDDEAVASGATPIVVDRCLNADAASTPSRVGENNLAYVIYTSGSTGMPNGVAIEHKSIVNTVCWRNDYYGFSPADVILQVPSFSFDSSVEDIFCALSSGAQLVLLDERDKLNPAALRRILSTHRITHMLVTPTYYKAILNETCDSMSAMKVVTIAGEAFDGSLVTQHFSKLPRVRLINEYGPTENSVCSTVHELTDGSVLIGKPINKVSCYVLNEEREEVAIGEEGELYIGGVGLARGYLNNPELTSARFVRKPNSGNEVLYRTGDLVTRTDDGSLRFLGRIDQQIKIRGFRIELGEIQQLLLQHEGIKDALVTAHKGQIHAYVIFSDRRMGVEEINGYLRSKLPGYMVPAQLLGVPAFPLLPNGKVDIDSLNGIASRSSNEAVVGEGDIAATVIAVIASHADLSREKLSQCVHDDLKNLGLDSISLLTLLIDLQDRYRIEFDFDALEEMSTITIDKIASIVSKLRSAARSSAA